MNIYRHELKSYGRVTLLWIAALCGFTALLMYFYPMLKADLDNFLKLIDNMPDIVKAAFGLYTATLGTPMGYYCFAFTYTSLFAMIQAANLGVGILSREEREKTADFLLTKPVSRTRILAAKLLAALTLLLATNLIYTGLTAAMLHSLDGELALRPLLLINTSLLITQWIFFCLGLAVSVMASKIRAVLPVSLGLVFVFYAISAFAVRSADDKLRYLTPFQYFKADYILRHSRYETSFAVTGLCIMLLCLAASFVLYRRRQIHAV